MEPEHQHEKKVRAHVKAWQDKSDELAGVLSEMRQRNAARLVAVEVLNYCWHAPLLMSARPLI